MLRIDLYKWINGICYKRTNGYYKKLIGIKQNSFYEYQRTNDNDDRYRTVNVIYCILHIIRYIEIKGFRLISSNKLVFRVIVEAYYSIIVRY